MEEKTPEQLKAIEEIRKPVNFPKWILFAIIVMVFLVFWYLSRNNGETKSNSSVLQDTTTIVHSNTTSKV
ncbi:MAG TPA: hypothetical protein VLS85_02410 [Hanamia sp.]|nr:hypothetical protein [Hanamia sp.]